MLRGGSFLIILAFHFSLFISPAKAADFPVRLNNGDTLYFNITDAARMQVSVVPPNTDGPNYYSGHRKPSGVLVIPSEVFFEGQRYTVTAIGERAFSGCNAIRMISIPSSVTVIGAYAFYGCTGINDQVIIGENISKVGPMAFYGCSQLPAVVFMARRCDVMGGSLATSPFANCSHLNRITFTEGVTRIPDFAFSGLDAVNTPITFPQSLEYIGDYAFSFCTKLPGELIIPNQVTSIGECAFNQCHSLTSLTIGASVKTIGNRAFYRCLGLNIITLDAPNPPSIEVSSFQNLSTRLRYSVPCVSKILYEQAERWKKIQDFDTHGPCTFSVSATPADSLDAIVLGSGEYKYGDTAVVTVVCSAGHGFSGWSDGNLDNPRIFPVTSDVEIQALTQIARTIVTTDTFYVVDTVYEEGYKTIYDTVDIFEALQPLDPSSPITYNSRLKNIEWNFPNDEKLLSLIVFNTKGDCIYRTSQSSGKLKMRRFPAGSYIVRAETPSRVLRLRFFVNP